MSKTKSRYLHKFKHFAPRAMSMIYDVAYRSKISIEEATLQVLIVYPQMREFSKDVLENYEILRDYKKDGIRETEYLGIDKIPLFEIKSEMNYTLFLKFYKAAKKDLKERGGIGKETLKIIEDAKSE